jgi:hypothetical protein
MNKKLLLTTALVGSVVLGGFAQAATKITGDLEVTLSSQSSEKAATNTGSSTIGREANLIVEGGNDTAIGALTYGTKFTVDGKDATATEWYTSISKGMVTAGIGQDMGAGSDIDGTVVPHVSDQADTLMRGTGSYISAHINPYSKAHVGLDVKALGGKFGVSYSPNNSNTVAESAAFTGDAIGDSAIEYSYIGSPVGYGISIQAAHAEVNGDATSKSAETNKFGVAYAAGAFKIGAAVQDYTNGNNGGSQLDYNSIALGATFTASDNLSIGIGSTEMSRSKDDAINAEEKIKFITVGYNLGGLGFDLSVANVDNGKFVSGDDFQIVQLRTINKF